MPEENQPIGPEQAPTDQASVWRRRLAVATVTVVAAIGVVSAGTMIVGEWLAVDGWFNPSHVETAVGQQRTLTLEDGSIVQVNTRSAVTIHYTPGKREVRLPDGEAQFIVAPNPKRPFIVTTPQACLRAVGTVFNVQVGAHRTSVAVLEGHVRVFGRAEELQIVPLALLPLREPPGRFLKPAQDLYAGQRAAVTDQGAIQRDTGPSIERVSAWTRRQLVFRDEPLSALVAEFNRYHDKKLRIVDPELAKFRVSGSFDAYDMPSLMQYLENYQGVHSRANADGSEMLTR